MKGSAILPVLVAGVIPFLVLALIVTGSGLGLVQWRPPTIWTDQFGTPGTNPNGVMGIAVSSTNVYAGGYLNATDYFTGVPFVRSNDFGGRVLWSTDITKWRASRFFP